MARKIIKSSDYTFNPATRTIVIPGYVKEERLILISNTNTGTIIYNFADAALGYSSWSHIGDVSQPRTQIVLEYNTAAMSSTDNLSIMVDEYAETMQLSEALVDTVDKIRVAAPQSLMDTDFEYSVQPSKWEALFLVANYPSFFAKTSGGNSFDIVGVAGNGFGPRSLVTVTTLQFHNLVTGNVVSIQDTLNFRAEGTFVVNSILSPTQFTYFARGLVQGEIAIQNNTIAYGGDAFENAHIPGGTASRGTLRGFDLATNGGNPTIITVTTPNHPHGLFPGTPILINNTSGANGNWIIKDVLSPTQFTFEILDTVVTSVSTSGSSILYAKPDSAQTTRWWSFYYYSWKRNGTSNNSSNPSLFPLSVR